jgi:hypothetical protein
LDPCGHDANGGYPTHPIGKKEKASSLPTIDNDTEERTQERVGNEHQEDHAEQPTRRSSFQIESGTAAENDELRECRLYDPVAGLSSELHGHQ